MDTGMDYRRISSLLAVLLELILLLSRPLVAVVTLPPFVGAVRYPASFALHGCLECGGFPDVGRFCPDLKKRQLGLLVVESKVTNNIYLLSYLQSCRLTLSESLCVAFALPFLLGMRWHRSRGHLIP